MVAGLGKPFPRVYAASTGDDDFALNKGPLYALSASRSERPVLCYLYDLEAPASSVANCALTLRNCSNAASKLSTISAARTSGGGRFSTSSRLSSLSQKISRFRSEERRV